MRLLQERLRTAGDPKIKAWWDNYVKESAPFLGVKMPIIRTHLHAWHEESVAERLDHDQQLHLALALIRERHSEEKLAGILFLQEILLPAGAIRWSRDLPLFAELFVKGHIYDWNICDWFCMKLLGPLIAAHGKGCATRIAAWHTADNLWQARASLVAFVKGAEDATFHPMIRRNCKTLIRRDERFAKTAVGWILREISRTDRPFVHQVIEENLPHFSIESLRNATKYFPKSERDKQVRAFKKA